MIFGSNYRRDRSPLTLKSYARQVSERLRSVEADLIFATGTLPIAYLESDLPIAIWADSVFAGMLDFYPDFMHLSDGTKRAGHHAEQRALTRCNLVLYASEWAAECAVRAYGIDPGKVYAVPFGANLECARTAAHVDRMLDAKNFDVCRLLFVGVEWHRKGGEMALNVTTALRGRGIPCELHVVGCHPTGPVPHYVHAHGYVSKRDAAGRELLERLYEDSHFLILPTRAECFGIVFAEASSYGVPSLATDIGGTSSAIRSGHNGQTFPLDCGAERYADFIATCFRSGDAYRRLAQTSFSEYEERLNWNVSGRRVAELIDQFCR
jgi:glycosyltransferase involved in cell wall biosynthesis